LDNRKNEKTHSFFIRRFFRIAPLYYVGIVFYTFLHFVPLEILFGTGKFVLNISYSEILSNFFFLHGIFPDYINHLVPGGWSIAVEMTFYLFVPILFCSITNIYRALLLLFVSIFTGILFVKLLTGNAYWDRNFFLYFSFLYQLPVFALGIIGYFIVVKNQAKEKKNTALLAIIFCVMVYICNVVCDKSFFWMLFAAGLFLLLLVFFSKYPLYAFVNPLTQFLGKISFSIYIFHFFFIGIVRHSFMNFIPVYNNFTAIVNFFIQFLSVLCATSGLSYLTYKYIEIPFQEIGKTIILKLN
jgi:peptidoglycan/LPS O-acetylase OafA/YrhL